MLSTMAMRKPPEKKVAASQVTLFQSVLRWDGHTFRDTLLWDWNKRSFQGQKTSEQMHILNEMSF